MYIGLAFLISDTDEYFFFGGCSDSNECVRISIGRDDDLVEDSKSLILRLEDQNERHHRHFDLSVGEATLIIEDDGM